MGRFERLSDRFRKAIAQLSHGSPDPQSIDTRQTRQTRRAGVDRYEPDEDKMDDYWELFEDVPLVREPIRAFATEVIADGYEVEAGSEEASSDLEDWLAESSIVNGEVDQDFAELVKEVIIQKEVRGTALVEIVDMKDGDGVYGFKSIPAHTVEFYTKPGQAVLLAPDEDTSDIDNDAVVLTDDGQVAAYVQWDDDLIGWSNRDPIPLPRDKVIKFTRDADAGDVFGTSRLAAVEDRVNSLTDKLDDNDKAIEFMAWKFWLFKFGTEEQPWPQDDIDTFMDNHKADNFQPGMKQGVQGDISIETVDGEVAEGLEEFLNFDVNWIISSMPLPKYALGGFEENVNQFVSRSQETRVNNQIREAREEIERKFTTVLKDKAEELGHSREDVELKLGDEEMMLPETDFTRPPASSEKEGQENEQREADEEEEGDEEDEPPAQQSNPAELPEDWQPFPEDGESLTPGRFVWTPDGVGVVTSELQGAFRFPLGPGEGGENTVKVEASADNPAFVVGFGGSAGVYREDALQALAISGPDELREMETDKEAPGEAVAGPVGSDDVELEGLPEEWDQWDLMSFYAASGGEVTAIREALVEDGVFDDSTSVKVGAKFKDKLVGTTRWRGRF